MPIVLSVFLPYLLGLGLVSYALFPALFEQIPRLTWQEKARLLAIIFIFGTITNYLLVLILASIKTALVIGGMLSLGGFSYGLFKLRDKVLQLLNLGWAPWLLLICLLSLYAVPIVLTPISEWDARSIWFFHGKMIYYSQALSQATGLDASYVQFSQVDYPKLLPVLAAQVATITGYWNEYLPKGSLLALLFPILLGFFSLYRKKRVSFFYLIFLLLFGLGDFLWNGYMDGYLALYTALSLLFWGSWLRDQEVADLITGTLLLGLALNLKSEGLLFLLSSLFSLFIMHLIRSNSVKLTFPWRFWLVAVVPFSCFLLWSLKKAAWGLKNWLNLGLNSLSIIHEHLKQGSWELIGRWLLIDVPVGKAAIMFLVALMFAKFMRVRLPIAIWFSATTALIYFVGIFCVYMAAPFDLNALLWSGASRTMMTVITALFVSTFLTFQELETQSNIK